MSRVLPFTLLAVLLTGLAGAFFNPALLTSPASNLADGSWASDYQTAFSEDFFLLEPARSAWNAFDLAVFGQAPAGVLTGEEGWLFTSEEFAHAAEPEAVRELWVGQIAEVNAALSDRGVPLLIALVPTKALSVPDLAPPLPRAGMTRYGSTALELAELGIATVDLRAALAHEDYWLRTDTHWTPAGATRAAELLAAAALELVPELETGGTDYAVESTETVQFHGDLERLLGLGSFAGLAPGPEELTVTTVARTSAPDGGLFADAPIDAVLVGTSYSAASEWNLADRLRLELAADILDLSESGRGPLQPMQEYLAGGSLETTPPRMVIWEIPERYLTDTAFLEESL